MPGIFSVLNNAPFARLVTLPGPPPDFQPIIFPVEFRWTSSSDEYIFYVKLPQSFVPAAAPADALTNGFPITLEFEGTGCNRFANVVASGTITNVIVNNADSCGCPTYSLQITATSVVGRLFRDSCGGCGCGCGTCGCNSNAGNSDVFN